MKTLTIPLPGHFSFDVLADSVNDSNSTRNVYLLAGGLAVLGIALLVITIWFWRSTRPEPALLAPLEIMGERKFRQLEVIQQHKLLDSVRPQDARTLRWGTVQGDPIEAVVIDLEAAARSRVIDFDDLREPATVLAEHDHLERDLVHDPLLSVLVAAAAAAAYDELHPAVEASASDEADIEVDANIEVEADIEVDANIEVEADVETETDNESANKVMEEFEPEVTPAPRGVPEGVSPAVVAPGLPLARELMDPLLRNVKEGAE